MLENKKFGAIDIGSNAVRLLIGEVCEDKNHHYIKKIAYNRLPVRLGSEVFDQGVISLEMRDALVKAMKAFSLIADLFGIETLRACATSAMRDAVNGSEIREVVRQESGIDIEVLSGDEEARLIFGTFSLLQLDKETSYVVIDVGGGSTEITVFEKGRKVAARSFNIGTVRMLKGRVGKSAWKELKTWLNECVGTGEHLYFGTGGNINKVHKLVGLRENQALSLRELNKLLKEMQPLSIDERIEHFQLKPDRADVIVPALEIFTFCMKNLKAKRLVVPKMGLSDGIIYDLHQKSRNP